MAACACERQHLFRCDPDWRIHQWQPVKKAWLLSMGLQSCQIEHPRCHPPGLCAVMDGRWIIIRTDSGLPSEPHPVLIQKFFIKEAAKQRRQCLRHRERQPEHMQPEPRKDIS